MTNLNRREFLKYAGIGATIMSLPAAKGVKAVAVNHLSYQSADYKKTRDFYVDLLGFQASNEDQNQLYLWAGDVMISAKNTPKATSPLIDHFGFTLDKWDVKAVQAALKERSLEGAESRNDANQKSVLTKDPNRYGVQLCAKDLEVRPAPVTSRAPLKTIGVNHISYQCRDYKQTRDFYVELLDVPVSNDDGKQAYLWFGDAFMVVRSSANGTPALIDHIAWTLADWDKDRVVSELKKRGIDASPDADGKSASIKDVNGYSVQLCSKDLVKRP